MLALKVKNLLKNKEIMSLAEIARELNTELEIIKEILEFWIEKGQITKLTGDNSDTNNQCCDDKKGCGGCTALGMELYRINQNNPSLTAH